MKAGHHPKSWMEAPIKIARVLSMMAVLCLLLSGTPPAAASSVDIGWRGNFVQNGPSGYIYAVAADGERVYYGGWFKSAGNALATSVAAWDPVDGWQSLGDGFYLEANAPWRGSDTGYIDVLAADGRGGLYATGDFDTVKNGPGQPGVTAYNIAHWDGRKWSALGEGVQIFAGALAVDPFGNLYTTGYFQNSDGNTIHTLARWDGWSWNLLGGEIANEGFPGGAISSIALSRDGYLYAGGTFTSLGGIPALNVARFDLRSGQWQALGEGLGQPLSVNHFNGVHALALDDRGNLYGGGTFTTTGTVTVENIAVWDGNSWQGLGEGLEVDSQTPTNAVSALAVDGDSLYAAGQMTRSGGRRLYAIARWDRTHPADGWQPVGGEITRLDYDLFISSMAVTRSGKLFVGGRFETAGNISAYNAAFWDGQAWHGLGDATSVGGEVYALAEGPDGKIYAGGHFAAAGSCLANSIASWDPKSGAWSALGEGVSRSQYNPYIKDVVADAGGNVYVGGDFTQAGSIKANSIAKWDGQNWQALDSGLTYTDTAQEGSVNALVIDRQGNMVAGGSFYQAGGVTVQNVARWTGKAWEAMGAGLPLWVDSLAVAPDGTIYAGGDFVIGSDPSTWFSVARWDGSQWQPMIGSGAPAGGEILVADGQSLFAGDWGGISQWTGSGWQSLGSLGQVSLLVKPRLGAMISDGQGGLYIGGYFSTIAGQRANGLAHWSALTQSWTEFGRAYVDSSGGAQQGVSALDLASSGRLYAGGDFYRVGDQASWAFAWWQAPALVFFPLLNR